jgi:hypothetical protein
VREWPLSLVPAEMDSPLLRFDTANPQFNQAVWNAMPGIFWSFPAIGAKPASRVLIEHSDPALRVGREKRPLLATGLYGPGRVVYVGFNGTWRWRRLGNDSEYYEKFWIQTVNFLIAGKDQRGSNRGFIDLSKDTYHRGDRVIIEAKLKDASFQPLDVPVVEATIKTAVGLVPLRLEKTGGETPGLYKAEIVATDLGQNVITIIPSPGVDGKPAQPIIKAFEVGLPRVEFENTRLNRALLTEMADRSNGKYFDVEDWSKVIAEVKDAGENPVVPRKPYELWSTDRLLLLLVFLLTVEWAVRKRYKLL